MNVDDYSKCISLRKRRKALGISMKYVAEQIGCSFGTIARYETADLVIINEKIYNAYDQFLSKCESGEFNYELDARKSHKPNYEAPRKNGSFHCISVNISGARHAKAPDYVIQNISDLYDARKCRGLTRAELADLAGIQHSIYSAIENMSIYPRPDSYNRLAKVLRWKLWQ